ncbi:hypothetical protein L228DRAFT_249736 [Xylona heveae TC161]|uniref:Uncharacterized protein n=1 Tax=Xylona heveae (strain CBS 132557 / TC161) TaxID=1328760 RepID=A0A165FF79_XYLHT|nr:hypothetical protein L228DRAFT_249736 [Xylona heveae TC161]KZF20904.1 hypothetical protein L228DRAFT_249736 [Xylona heveae TC161]
MNRMSSGDFEDWPLRLPQRGSSISSSTQDSDSASILSLSQFPVPPSPATSSATSGRSKSIQSFQDETIRLQLHPAVTISFLRGAKLFKIQHAFIDICKDASGHLKYLELGGGIGHQSVFLHTFQNTKLPVPHLEQPRLTGEKTFRVSFLEEQTVQTGQTVFNTQLSYTFYDWEDCVRFQELLLASKIILTASLAEASSKGRGEECISQNLRILQGWNDRRVILFFANSQRKEKKTYVSIPLHCIDRVVNAKKAGHPVALHLCPNFDILSQMKVLRVSFLDDEDRIAFFQTVSQGIAHR